MTTMFPTLDAIYERYRKAENIPGLVYGVVQKGELVHVKGLGVASAELGTSVQPETFFRIASMTKVVTALAVLLLRDRGVLTLEAPVASLVPGFAKVRLPTADSRPPTVRDLLSHTGGLVTDDPWGDRLLGMPAADFDRLLAEGLEFSRAPQIDFEYANLGYALLGRVIEAAAGEPYSGFVRREILQPIGMPRSTFEVGEIPPAQLAMGYRWFDNRWTPQRLEPDGAFGAMGGITTNAVEYARFIAFMLDAWPARDGEDGGPVARASRREVVLAHSAPRAPSFRQHQGRTIAAASAYGYGIVNTMEPELGRTIHHRGGLPGYGSHFLLSPETGIGLFSFGNRTYAATNEPNVEAAQALKDAGLWAIPQPPVSRHIAQAMETVAKIYRAGRVEEAPSTLALNLLLDRGAEERDRELADIAARLGALTRIEPEPINALHTRFLLICARGRACGELILTGEATPKIQTLNFEIVAG